MRTAALKDILQTGDMHRDWIHVPLNPLVRRDELKMNQSHTVIQ